MRQIVIRHCSRTFLKTSVLLILLTIFTTGQDNGIRINRLEIQAPWTGFYVGQGRQMWGKAVVNNSSDTALRELKVQFEFFDPVGPRETFTQQLASIQPGGTVSVESPQWWDYSGADIGMKVTVLGPDTSRPLAERSTGG